MQTLGCLEKLRPLSRGLHIKFLDKDRHKGCMNWPYSSDHATYRVIHSKWKKGGTLYIWYRWTYPEILFGGGSHKLFFLFGVS